MSVENDTLDTQAFLRLNAEIMQTGNHTSQTMLPPSGDCSPSKAQTKRLALPSFAFAPPGSAPETRKMDQTEGKQDARLAATFNAFDEEGDTQPMPSQIYHNFINAQRQRDPDLQQEDSGMDLMAGLDTQFSPAMDPPHRQIHSVDESIDDNESLDLLSSMRKDPAPKTPGLAGLKRNRDGETITPTTYSKTPGSGLTNMFGPLNSRPLLTATQLFNNTQAVSSPMPDDARSDPLDTRPSPDFAHHADYSPSIRPSSSPTKPLFKAPPTSTGPRDVYRPMDESQRKRQLLARQQKAKAPSSSKVMFDFDDDTQLDESYEQRPHQGDTSPFKDNSLLHEDEDAIIELSDRVSSVADDESMDEYDEYAQDVFPSQTRAANLRSDTPEILDTDMVVAGSPPFDATDSPQSRSHARASTNNLSTVANTQPDSAGPSYPPRPVVPSSMSSFVPGSQIDPPSSQTRAVITARLDAEKLSSLPMPPVTSEEANALENSHVPSSPPPLLYEGSRVQATTDVGPQSPLPISEAGSQDEAEVVAATNIEATSSQVGAAGSRVDQSNEGTMYTTAPTHVTNSQGRQIIASQAQQSSTESPVKVRKARLFSDMDNDPHSQSAADDVDISIGMDLIADTDPDFTEAMKPPPPPSPGSGRLQAVRGRKFRERMKDASETATTPDPRKVYKEDAKAPVRPVESDGESGSEHASKRRRLARSRQVAVRQTESVDALKSDDSRTDSVDPSQKEAASGIARELPPPLPANDDAERARPAEDQSTRATGPQDRSAYHNRVLALFNGSVNGYYPATCTSVTRIDQTVRYHVRFDDGTCTSLERHHICAFDVQPEDIVKVDLPNMRTHLYVIHGFNEASEADYPADAPSDIHGHRAVQVRLKRKDSAKNPRVTAATAAIDRPVTIGVGSIYVTQSMWVKFQSRAYDHPQDPSRQHTPSISDVSLAVTPTSRSRRPTSYPSNLPALVPAIGSSATPIFANMAFAISSTSLPAAQRDRLINLLTSRGAHVLPSGLHELFVQSSTALTLSPDFSGLGFTALLADAHSRNTKYIQALALGLPTISHKWASDCVAAGKILDWPRYLLPAGHSAHLDAVRSRTLVSYNPTEAKLATILDAREKLLSGGQGMVLLAPARKKDDRRDVYAFLGLAMGAAHVRRADTLGEAVECARKREWGWVHCAADDMPTAAKAIGGKSKIDEAGLSITCGATRVVCDEWVIQNLILGA